MGSACCGRGVRVVGQVVVILDGREGGGFAEETEVVNGDGDWEEGRECCGRGHLVRRGSPSGGQDRKEGMSQWYHRACRDRSGGWGQGRCGEG